MSIQFFEGFETVGTELGLANEAIVAPRVKDRWTVANNGGTPSLYGFFLIDDFASEGYALSMGNTSPSNGNYLQWDCDTSLRQAPGPSFDEWIVGFRIHTPLVARTGNFLHLRSLFGGTFVDDSVTMSYTNSADLVITRANPGTFTIDTVVGAFTPGEWHYMEVRFKIADFADGGRVEVWINDILVSDTTADTNNSLSTGFTGFQLHTNSSSTANGDYTAYDDIYAIWTGAAPLTDRLGSVRVRSIPPDSDVIKGWDRTSGTQNYPLVNENGADDTTGVSTDINNTRDRYGITDVPGNSTVMAVKAEAEAINQTGGTPSLTVELTSGATVDANKVTVDNTVDYDLFTLYWEEDPNTSAPWTNAAVNAMQAGYLFENEIG